MLPKLLLQHSEETVKAEASQLLTPSQLKECWKRLEARKTRLVWLHGAISEPGARLLELAIIITDESLNEIERGEWVFGEMSEEEIRTLPAKEYSQWCDKKAGGPFPPSSPGLWGNGLLAEVLEASLTSKEAAVQIVEFLDTHCARGCTVAGTAVSRDLEVILKLMPEVHGFLDCHAPIDVGNHGAQRYAQLVGKSLKPVSDLDSAPRTIAEFEAAHRDGNDPAQLYKTLGRPTRAHEHLENSIVALGWVRMHFFPPAKAAKYVMGTLGFMCVLLLGTVVKLIATETIAWYSST